MFYNANMVAVNLDDNGDDVSPSTSTYLVLGHNDHQSSRIDFLSNAPSDYDLKHQVVCIRFDSRVALEKVLDGFRNLSDYSVPSIIEFVAKIPSINVRVENRLVPFRSAFHNQYQVLWQRTS